MERKETTTIQISKELRHFLATQSIIKDETYDQILRRLLEKLWGAKLTDVSTAK